MKAITSALLLVVFLALGSCGKKGPLKFPGEQKRPKFDKVVDEVD